MPYTDQWFKIRALSSYRAKMGLYLMEKDAVCIYIHMLNVDRISKD